MNSTNFYNTQHSPIGAFASFTLGAKGAKGGFGLELAKPADQNVFIGLEDPSDGHFSCLPFFDVESDESIRFDVEGGKRATKSSLRMFPDSSIRRTLLPGSDLWEAGDLTFMIHSPVVPAPEPGKSDPEVLRQAYVPSLPVEVTVDNRESKKPRRFFFGFQGSDPYRGLRRMDETAGFVGVANGSLFGVASDSPGVVSAQGFSVEEILSEADPFNYGFLIGSVGLLIATIPAQKKATINFAACFYRGGNATSGLESRYHYTRHFRSLEAVAEYTFDHFSVLKSRGSKFEKSFASAKLTPARRFMLSQAIHSYYASTELLEVGGSPMWIVNEGEYRMINTFDLTVDQLFFEMKLNPWTVRNELDWFVKRYSYTDKVVFPGGSKEHPGGLSFTHDMGVANHISARGRSVYEKAGLHGCFSHMTHEELVNWIICGLVYEKQTGDSHWLEVNLPVFQKTLTSLLNRDHPDPDLRNGVMALDSSRCAGGSEITTYDSLDVSLGQARNNLYLAVKCWGCYVGLASMFERAGDASGAETCRKQALRAAMTVAASADEHGLLPAILNENVPSRIIPAIEGLIIPYALGLKSALSEKGDYGSLIKALKRHLVAVLKPGICLFPDGAWKISSTSDNSWLSKIYLCQFVAENILKCVPTPAMDLADERHADWLLSEENLYWAWSDQMVSGIAKGSKYYPRGVTGILWLSGSSSHSRKKIEMHKP